MVGERRQHARLVPSSPLFVSLDASMSGLLLDVCQGGIAVASLIPRNLDDVIALEFELPEGCGRVSVKAEIAWTRDSGHLSGARFVDLDEYSRKQLGQWIGTTASSAIALVEEQPSLFNSEPIENGSKAPVESHPVDAYFLEPPNKDDRNDENVISDGMAGPVCEQQAAATVAKAEQQNHAEWVSTNREEIDQLVRETETSENTPDSPGLIRNRSDEVAAEICDDPARPAAPAHGKASTETAPTATEPIESASVEQEETPVFVTRSTYTQVEGAAEQEHGAYMHLERVFQEPFASVAVEQATDLAVQPWHMPRPAGPQILTDPGLTGASEKSRHTIELILAVVLLSWALVFLGYQMGSTGISPDSAKETDTKSAQARVADENLVRSVQASPGLVSTTPASTSNSTTRRETATGPAGKGQAESASTLGNSAMVLQVGAMRLEDNANTLARDLQKKNMPAFVFRHDSDRLYRVAVGPYSDEQATVKAKSSLEKQGLKPILRRWLPE
jgi:cell division septation protein DedD